MLLFTSVFHSMYIYAAFCPDFHNEDTIGSTKVLALEMDISPVMIKIQKKSNNRK